jgi:thiamine biosynthesis lipoprotein
MFGSEMPRPSRPIVRVLFAWLCGLGAGPAIGAEDFTFYHENVMGTSMELRVVADDAEAARLAEERVLREIDRLSKIFSGYDPTSEFSRWQAAPRGPVKVSPELLEVLQACDRWRDLSGGAFDPRVEALTRLWSSCARQDRMPDADELTGARDLMCRPAWRIDPASGTAERLSDCPLSLNAIAKGDIVERACVAGLDPGRGVRGLMLNIGGDLRVCGDLAQRIGIASPAADSETTEPIARIEVRGRAVATSGNYQRGLKIQGKWHSHIFDPRSCLPAAGTSAATVIAEKSADADALATIFNVLAPEECVRLANTLPGVDCLIVTTSGQVARSDGWHRYESPRPAPLALADAPKPAAPGAVRDADNVEKGEPKAASRAPWGDEFELLVNFEINRPDTEGGRYRRPFVAVWVEDTKGFPVRNVSLWVSLGGPGPWEWMKDLRHWHRSDQVRKQVDKRDMVFTISRPTRPPGKYSVIWDGKDDHGKPVERGEYTLYIDAAREHGTYQSIRKPLTIGDAPFAAELEGNVEVKSASVEYRRKSPAK